MSAVSATEFGGGWSAMAERSQHSFIKRQKEIERKQKAQEKMARRQGKKKQAIAAEKEDAVERPGE